MYEQVTPRRRTPLSILAWVLAIVLSLAAVVGTVWVLTRDLSDGQAAPTGSATGQDAAGPGTTADGGTGPSTASPDPSPTPTPEPPPPTVVALRSAVSGRCLDVPGGAAADGAALQIHDCNGTAAQQWTATGSGELRTLGSMCLDDPSGGQPGGPATIWTCHGGANQQWSPQPDGTVRNVATGLCLDVSGAASDNGTPAIMYGCHAGDNQRWSIS